MPSPLRWYALSAAVIALDYATKLAVLRAFAPGESLAIAPFFNMVLVFNTGAAFSFLAGAQGWQTLFFAAIAIIASVVIVFLINRNRGKNLLCGGLALILGGALGNLHDRLMYGKVVDFLDFYALGVHFPAFNVADSAIVVGVGLMLIDSLIGDRQRAP